MRCCIYKVGEGDQGSGEPNCRTIQRRDQDLGMSVEGMSDV